MEVGVIVGVEVGAVGVFDGMGVGEGNPGKHIGHGVGASVHVGEGTAVRVIVGV